ncbi:GAF domain-containing sensor histidine kinase [Loktanella sp. M215]|uniref:GAF domain-containing sensor histidine kinase n=1 Tax=Loktanella sp. M215 TaxID=2675431 RepID=UPI001F29B235|nr:GAF domain-containing sensor histidine kinase [Loktanella sp. M215]MCF7700953.1 GAF domain-containing protein [Loktanella sp. M215]
MNRSHDFQDDIDAIGRCKSVPTLLETVNLATGMGFAAVARVTASRWITCRAIDHISFGLTPGDELDVESTLCHEVRQYDREIVIDDVQDDPLYVNHHCPSRYGFRSYISVPIRRADGSFFGTLCAIDPAPHKLKDDRVLAMFRLFAKLIGESLDAEEALLQSKQDVTHERTLAGVQEQFIAILAHDLRNPVSALTAGLRMIERGDLDSRAKHLVDLMRGSVNRMGLLIENLLDQARNRRGEGIVIERTLTPDLNAALSQIVAELQAVSPDQEIRCDIDLAVPVYCDAPRVSQLFSNLLANAITHGAQDTPIHVTARAAAGAFTLSVANAGTRIADEMLQGLFMPYERGGDRPSREGLGLGLFIASEIAKGHDGTLDVDSGDVQTVFTFQMPNVAAPV